MSLRDMPKATLLVCRGLSIQTQAGLVQSQCFQFVDPATTYAHELTTYPGPMLAEQWCNTWFHISLVPGSFSSNSQSK